MTRVATRSLLGRKLRTFLTLLAVLLGVALMAGSYILTDTINASFDDIFQETSKGVDVAVVPKEEVENEEGLEPPAFSAQILDRVKEVDGVAEASGGIFDLVSVLGDDGDPLATGGAPNFAASTLPEAFDPFTYVEGRAPRTDREVAIDSFTADKENFEIGETIRIVGDKGAKPYSVVGRTELGEVESFGGASVAVMTLAEAQRATDKEGKFDEISISAEEGVPPEELKQRVDAALPPSVIVRTGQENADQQSKDSADDLGFLQTFLLVFAFIALFVGAFTIFNTFSITVAQRTREFGMLRTIGASRRQILASVIVEAVAIGLLGGLLGILGGIGAAEGISALFKSVGFDLPNTGTVIATRTIVVSLIVGTLVTFIAAISPALRATRVSPMEALSETAIEPRGRRKLVARIAVALTVLGLVPLIYGLFGGIEDGDAAAALVGLGAVVIFIGVALMSPRFVRPLASGIGRPIEALRGVTGRLARENAVRNPGRTAATAAALMIGLALVTFVTVFAAGLKKSFDETIEKSFVADLTLQNVDGFSPFPAEAARQIKRIPGVGDVSSVRFSESKIEGTSDKSSFMGAVDPATIGSVFEFEWKDGSNATLAQLGRDGTIVDEKFAEKEDLKIGDQIKVVTPTGKHTAYTVKGTFKDNTDFFGEYVIPTRTLDEDFDVRKDSLVLVDYAPGANQEATRTQIDKLLDKSFPTAESNNQKELSDNLSQQIDELVSLLYALLALAVIVSLFGLVNTLALAIFERTREIGMLRAIGTSRRQVRRMVRYEAVITALIGAVIGAGLGLVFSVVISRPLADEGFVLSFPILTLLVLFILAALAGVVAAILPARRASRLDVLEALAYE